MTGRNLFPLLISLCFLGCNKKVAPQTVDTSQVAIEIDDRIQLFRVAYNLAIMDSIDQKYQPCKNEFYAEHFDPYTRYAGHPFVQKIAMGDHWAGDLPMLALALDHNLDPRTGLDTLVLARQFGWYGSNLDSLSLLMKDFKKDIGFNSQYHMDFKPLRDSIEANEVTQKLNTFFRKVRDPALTIFYDPFNGITSRAVDFLPDDDKKRTFVLNNVCERSTMGADTTSAPVWNRDTRRIIIHENTHLYTNDLFDHYYSDAFDQKLNQSIFEKDYKNIDELIVRGITAKIIQINYGAKAGGYEIARQPERSRLVYDALDSYLANDKMTFESIYGQIMEELQESYQ